MGPLVTLISPSSEHEAVDRADRRALLAALRRLTPRQREVIVLRYWLDLSLAEVARVTGQSVAAVKSHVHRALARLAREVGETR